MATVKFYSYSMGSRGLNLLREELESRSIGTTLIKKQGSRYKGSNKDVVVNWGNTKVPKWLSKTGRVYNKPQAISKATNKLEFFKILSRRMPDNIPEFTTSMSKAKKWAKSDSVYCRKLLSGSQGRGIVVAKSPAEVVQAPLYTKGIKATREYRVHVFDGEVIDIAKKYSSSNTYSDVRNLENGWTYIRQGIDIPTSVKKACIEACKNLKLDFCALDIIISKNKCFFLEGNTAPGMMGSTVGRYANAVAKLLK